MSRLTNLDYKHYIRLTRQNYNYAILIRNIEAICSYFTSDYHVVTGRGVQSHGVDEQRHRWTAMFRADPIMLYRRRTRKLRFSEQSKHAEELGSWAGKYSLNQKINLVAGLYSAKWQRQAGGLWLIQSEVFTTIKTTCCENYVNSYSL